MKKNDPKNNDPKNLDELKEDPENPRAISESALAGLKRSLANFGDLSGITWNKRTGELVCGHQRIRAIRESHGSLPIVFADPEHPFIQIPEGEKIFLRVVDWPKLMQRQANIVANVPTITGTFTEAIIPQLQDFQISDSGLFDALSLPSLLENMVESFGGVPVSFIAHPSGVDPDEIPEIPSEPTTKLGDVYKLGRHRLICGDATDAAVLAALLQKEKPGLIITDPPYGIGYEYKDHDDTDAAANADLVARVFAPHACGKIWTPGLMNLARDVGRFGKTKILVWNKKFAMAGNGLGGASTWEPVLVINPTERKLSNDVLEIMTDREKLDGESLRDHHPCPKPVALYEALILGLSKEKEKILEPFGGSGTTLIAAERTGRTCFAVEMSPSYCDLIVKRWEILTGKKAELENKPLTTD